tara:strand:+ start:10361 stop:10690 length:330 start_codon:yes stop_codon:yes gene_type:complete
MAQSPRSLNINLSLLESHPKKEWLLANLRKQLAKDLNCPEAEVPASDLEKWLNIWLEKHQSQGYSFSDLFYRIDLAEKYLNVNTEEIAQAILKREAIKVYFRAQYSGII